MDRHAKSTRSRAVRSENVRGMPAGDHLTTAMIAASLGVDAGQLETCAKLNGVHPQGPERTFTRDQADHVRALCSIGPTFGP
jgi:hypothetical protein